VLIYPLKEVIMIGTSDIPIEDPEDARCTESEIDYFIEMVKLVFPEIPVKREQIVFQFSGVRPLPASDTKATGQISRDHSIKEIAAGNGLDFPIYSLVGGKWTSFRAFSEEVADKTLATLNLLRKTDTRDLAIGGGRDYPTSPATQKSWIETLSQRTKLPPNQVSNLFERYGTRAEEIAVYISQGTDSPVSFLPEYTRREIEFVAVKEKVVHLDDFLLRRSMLAKLGQLSHAKVDEISKIISKALGWSSRQADEELKRVYAILRERHGINL
jgi:glycerol-3-phosphate dehydrogenase